MANREHTEITPSKLEYYTRALKIKLKKYIEDIIDEHGGGGGNTTEFLTADDLHFETDDGFIFTQKGV